MKQIKPSEALPGSLCYVENVEDDDYYIVECVNTKVSHSLHFVGISVYDSKRGETDIVDSQWNGDDGHYSKYFIFHQTDYKTVDEFKQKHPELLV